MRRVGLYLFAGFDFFAELFEGADELVEVKGVFVLTVVVGQSLGQSGQALKPLLHIPQVSLRFLQKHRRARVYSVQLIAVAVLVEIFIPTPDF